MSTDTEGQPSSCLSRDESYGRRRGLEWGADDGDWVSGMWGRAMEGSVGLVTVRFNGIEHCNPKEQGGDRSAGDKRTFACTHIALQRT